MHYEFIPKRRVCPKKFMLDISENGIIEDFDAVDGCFGNLQGIRLLVRGRHIDDIINILEPAPLCPVSKLSSCPQQLRAVLLKIREGTGLPAAAPHAAPGV